MNNYFTLKTFTITNNDFALKYPHIQYISRMRGYARIYRDGRICENMLKQDGTEQGHTQIRFRLSKGGPFSIESHHAKLQHIRFCSTA